MDINAEFETNLMSAIVCIAPLSFVEAKAIHENILNMVENYITASGFKISKDDNSGIVERLDDIIFILRDLHVTSHRPE